jgi:hypothetical protein
VIEMAAWAAALVAAAVVAFGMSVRFGMLLGRRVDGVLEERASAGDPPLAGGAGQEEMGGE